MAAFHGQRPGRDPEARRREGARIIGLLQQQAPKFQLQSGTAELRSSEAFLFGLARRTDDMARASHANSAAVLEFIAGAIPPDATTLETGGGWSTCVFAGLAKRHYCVNPDITANELIRVFLDRNAVAGCDLVFLGQPSDAALPALAGDCVIDVALIDGNHSFPIPAIDWHYIDLRMRCGGLLLVDDTHIPSVAVVCEFLDADPGYLREATIGNLAAYRKLADERVWGWADQGFNAARSRRATSCRKALGTWLSRWFRR